VNTQSIHCGFALKTPEKQCVKNSPNLKLLKICDFSRRQGEGILASFKPDNAEKAEF
jgi:hypothetical protein